MPDKFDLSAMPPPNVVEDVGLFVEGKVTFHELPRKQGRRQRVIRTIIGDQPLQSGGVDGAGCSIQPQQRAGGSGLSGVPDETVRDRKAGQIRRRQLSPKRTTESGRERSAVPVVVPKVLPVAEAKAPEVTVKRKPGRPRRVT